MAEDDFETTGKVDKRPRQGGRSARVVAAIYSATLALIEECGYDDVEIPKIARRAQVNKTSIYRRWPDKRHLVLDVALDHLDDVIPIADTGSLDGDLFQLLSRIRFALSQPFVKALLQVQIADDGSNKELKDMKSRFWRMRFNAGSDIVKRAVKSGQLPAQINETHFLECAVAPLFYRSCITGMEVTDEDIHRFARQACAAFS